VSVTEKAVDERRAAIMERGPRGLGWLAAKLKLHKDNAEGGLYRNFVAVEPVARPAV
jgi:hypothetical protein